LKIVRDSNLCHGARMCSIMCSFHHRKKFSPEFSSIHVLRNNKTGNISWSVDSTCDECRNEEEPFCIRYCFHDALRREES
jgi:Fe-S-cluster-containing hydrogenase component 2